MDSLNAGKNGYKRKGRDGPMRQSHQVIELRPEVHNGRLAFRNQTKHVGYSRASPRTSFKMNFSTSFAQAPAEVRHRCMGYSDMAARQGERFSLSPEAARCVHLTEDTTCPRETHARRS